MLPLFLLHLPLEFLFLLPFRFRIVGRIGIGLILPRRRRRRRPVGRLFPRLGSQHFQLAVLAGQLPGVSRAIALLDERMAATGKKREKMFG